MGAAERVQELLGLRCERRVRILLDQVLEVLHRLRALRFLEVRIGQGETVGKICRSLCVSEQTYYKWRREYGGLKMDQAKRLKELERENERLKKAVSELTLDKLILKEALSGKY